ncbi:MAG: inositol monophosphatase [Akkermansiaceae bacterium]
MNLPLEKFAALAEAAARSAADVTRQAASDPVRVEEKEGGDSRASQIVTEVDIKCQTAILEVLEPSFQKYDLGLLTEELEDDGSRLEKPAFWCVDPLDGTLPFTERRPGYAVSIALVARD